MVRRGVRERLDGVVIEEQVVRIAVRIDLGVGINRAIARRAVFGHLNAQLARKIVCESNAYLWELETRCARLRDGGGSGWEEWGTVQIDQDYGTNRHSLIFSCLSICLT